MVSRFQSAVLASFFLGIAAVSAGFSQETATGRVVVTAVAKHDAEPAAVPQETVSVSENGKRREISAWVPLRDSRAGLQLALLLDDSSRGSLSLQFNDIANFIRNLPPTTEVAIGYMRNGGVNLATPFTTDHASALKGLRTPIGVPGVNGSPYFCLSDMVRRWPQSPQNVRREVIMITDGADPYYGRHFDPENPYVRRAITDAQKAGVIVYSIYYRGTGAFDRGSMEATVGQNYLTQVSDGTGGTVYTQGLGSPVSLVPFFSDIQRRLENQYELSFESTSRKGLQPFRVKTTQPNVKLAAPQSVLVGVPVQQ